MSIPTPPFCTPTICDYTTISKVFRQLYINKYTRTSSDTTLSAGYPVIEICGPGLFTRGGHFILLTGIDEQGNVRINDPGSKNRTYKITGQTYDIDTIMSNASTNQGLDAVTFWVIS